MDTTTTGARLTNARRSVGLTRHDLALEAGLPERLISQLETGARQATRLELLLIADSCGVLGDDLIGVSTIAREVHHAGCPHRVRAQDLADYLTYAFGISRRLDQLGIPEVGY